MNPLGDLLTLDDIHLDVDVANKAQLLDQIAGLLSAPHGMSKPVVLESLTGREQLGSTGVGHGVAIPHARMGQCVAPAGTFVRTRYAIPFDAPDGKPVTVFIGLVVPAKANERHLQLLAAAAGMLSDRTLRETVKTAMDPARVRELLAAWPNTPATRSGD
jgi:nitrogen PTS system EIIA component